MGVIASYLLRLEPLNPGATVHENLGVKSRGLLYELLGQEAPALATRLHDTDGVKPFTASALLGRLEHTADGQLRVGAGPYQLRYTALNEELIDALSTVLYRVYATATPVQLGDLRFRVRRVITASEETPWGHATTHERLLALPPAVRWRLQFHSPTSFNQQHGHMPLPVPVSVFRSGYGAWTAPWSKAPALAPDLLQQLEATVFPSRLEIKTRSLSLDEKAKAAGFVGRVDFRVVRALPPEILRQANALAHFLYYSGVGHGTPRGCGQVSLVPQPLAGAADEAAAKEERVCTGETPSASVSF